MKAATTIAAILTCALVTGCWDQKLMKNERTVSIGGIDPSNEGRIRYTVSVRDTIPKGGGTGEVTNEIHSADARSTQQAEEMINAQVSGDYSTSKMRVLLLGEEMVRRRDVMPYLDVFYRDSRSPLDAKIAVVEGSAEKMIHTRKVGSRTVGVFIDQLLSSSREMDIIPSVNIQTLHPLDRGYDFSVPYLTYSKGTPSVRGLALFSGIRMTDWLNMDESKIYLLLCNNRSNRLNITVKTKAGRVQKAPSVQGYGYVTFEVHKYRRSLRIFASNEEIAVNLGLKMKVFVKEDPSDHLYKLPVMHDLEKQLSSILTEQAEQVVDKIKKANHDGLGIARRLMSYHPRIWKKLDWDKTYPQIRFDTSVSVKIVNTGITQ